METKVCYRCGIAKNLEEFPKDKNRKDGLFIYCKKCKNELSKEFRINNAEKLRQKARDNYYRNKEIKIEYQKNYYLNNKEKCKEKSANWVKNNLEKSRDIKRKWKQVDQLRSLLRNCFNRAKKKDIKIDIFQSLYDYLKPKYDEGFCECCGCKLENHIGEGNKRAQDNAASIDRIIPENGYIVGNLALLCWRCNWIKNNATPEEHRRIADWQEKRMNEIVNNP